MGTRPGPAAKEAVVCSTRDALPADVETNEAGGCRGREHDLMSEPLRDHLGNWNSAFRMQDINSNQAFRPGSNLFSYFPRQSSILGLVLWILSK